jgi:hypothetical protein
LLGQPLAPGAGEATSSRLDCGKMLASNRLVGSS